MHFGRLLTAMVTPFTADNKLDVEGIYRLVEHLIQTGTTAIVASGTTGESPTLSHDEKCELFRHTVAAAAGRIPIIAGTGGNDTVASIRLSKEAEELGVNGLLLVAPYYNRPSQEGLYVHFKQIADSVAIPVMLYNIPSRTGVNIEAETILRLAEVENIFAVKEASGNFAQFMKLAAEKPDDFFMYSGDDKFTLPMMAIGAFGVVSVASHVIGQEMTSMMDAFCTGRNDEAAVWAARLLPIMDALFSAPSPAPLKAALHQLGLPGGQVRLPLVKCPDVVNENVLVCLQRLGKV